MKYSYLETRSHWVNNVFYYTTPFAIKKIVWLITDHLFQHPFISNATDPKPILDLLAEFKAEIVEEEIMDLNEDKEVRTMFFPPFRRRSNLLRMRKLMTEELFEKKWPMDETPKIPFTHWRLVVKTLFNI